MRSVAKTHLLLTDDQESDLFSISSGDFSVEDRQSIARIALKRLEDGDAWPAIVTDFHRNGYWGFLLLSKNHPLLKKTLSEEQIQTRDVRRFFWTAVQSLLIMKGFILYFGLNYAIEREAFYGGRDKEFYAWGLGISVFVSFGALLLFAIRQGGKRVWD
jgi:hypothetical protein